MLSRDLKIQELLTFDATTGFPLFGSVRIMVVGLTALAKYKDHLIHSLGREKASAILSCLGYEMGMSEALNITNQYDFETPEEALKAVVSLQTMAGWARGELTDIALDTEKKSLRLSGKCRDSFEAVLWQKQDGLSDEPVCHLLAGALSGYASVIMGGEVLIKEITCQTQGHEFCTFEGRTLQEWGLDDETFRRKFSLTNLDEELARLKSQLEKANEDLTNKNIEIKHLKELYLVDSDEEITSRSSSMINLKILAKRVASTKATVLIQGESGTGKEVLAKFIHENSESKGKPFLAINCAALPSNLLESELFGHVKGAFTGADKDKKGLFVEAGEGTLFLDEIGEMPLEVQPKLLRAIQQKEVRQVGGVKDIPVTARIIAATNRDLKKMTIEGHFREDLYYRLAVFPLLVPPLRERKQDILLLARYFLNRLKRNHPGFSPQSVKQMEAYSWPGNVRELENWVEHAFILAGNDRIMPEHFPEEMSQSQDLLPILGSDLPTCEELLHRYTQVVLERTRFNKTEAARILGIGPATLWRRLKQQTEQ
jgi:DNA-binding NtrC family response regulator/predicted hydrocarbon binding protein